MQHAKGMVVATAVVMTLAFVLVPARGKLARQTLADQTIEAWEFKIYDVDCSFTERDSHAMLVLSSILGETGQDGGVVKLGKAGWQIAAVQEKDESATRDGKAGVVRKLRFFLQRRV